MPRLALSSVLVPRPLSSPAASARAPGGGCPAPESASTQIPHHPAGSSGRKRTAPHSPGTWPAPPDRLSCPAPHPRPAPTAKSGQPHPGSIPPRQLPRPPLLPLGRVRVDPPPDCSPYTLTLARLNRACLKQLQASQATGNTPAGSTPVVAGSPIAAPPLPQQDFPQRR